MYLNTTIYYRIHQHTAADFIAQARRHAGEQVDRTARQPDSRFLKR